jgi:peptidoglycan/xylan/chitin deacetylase (PgdA/CDA1 family)
MISTALSYLDRCKASAGVILAFHEISEPALERQLLQISKNYQFVPLLELADRLKAGRSTKQLAAITYDDGLSSQIEAAVKIGMRQKWPMTFFLPTRYLDTNRPYWFHELGMLLKDRENETLSLNGKKFPLKGKGRDALSRYFYGLSSPETIEAHLKEIRRWSCGSEDFKTSGFFPKPVSWARVRELAQDSLFHFESHSVDHLPLNALSVGAINREMAESASRIEAETRKKVNCFCYPFGSPAIIGRNAVECARKKFQAAVTLARGRCHAEADPWALPRIGLYESDASWRVALKLALT